MDVTTVRSAREVLGSEFTINKLPIKNRIVLGPMSVLRPTEDGRPSAQTIAFFKRRAAGGVGLIIVGGSVATERAWRESPFSPNLRFDKDEFVADLKRLTDAVHEYGTPVFAQLFPSFGRMGVPRDGHRISAASPKPVNLGVAGLPDHVYIPGGRITPPPHEATVAEIKGIEADVVAAARRAKAAGFDGLEIGAHMCYFYSSFLSPLSNQRTDEYGGSAENRARALRDAVAAVRAEVGPDFPIGIRMSVNDHMPGGQGPEGLGRGRRPHRAGRRRLHRAQRRQLRVAAREPAHAVGQHARARRAAGVPQGRRGRRAAVPVQHTRPAAGRRRRSQPGTPTRRCSRGSCSPTPTTPPRSSRAGSRRSCGATRPTPACAGSCSTSRCTATRTRRWVARTRTRSRRTWGRTWPSGRRATPS